MARWFNRGLYLYILGPADYPGFLFFKPRTLGNPVSLLFFFLKHPEASAEKKTLWGKRIKTWKCVPHPCSDWPVWWRHCCDKIDCVWAELVWSSVLDSSLGISLCCFPGARWRHHITTGIHPAMDWCHVSMLIHTQGQFRAANPLTQTVTRAQDRVSKAGRCRHHLPLHPAALIQICSVTGNILVLEAVVLFKPAFSSILICSFITTSTCLINNL